MTEDLEPAAKPAEQSGRTMSGVELAGYGDLFDGVANVIRETEHRVVRSTNAAVLGMYWQIGRLILDRQASEVWGAKVLDRLAIDLRAEFPTRRGFSRSNLHTMRSFAQAWPDGAAIIQQPVGQLPWGHVGVLIQRLNDPETREFYASRAAEHGWSRAVLEYQISTRFHLRIGQAPSNFATTIPLDQQDLTRELAVDPYRLDLLTAGGSCAERDLEDRLVGRMTEFVASIGVGLAYLGRQYRLVVGEQEFFVDLLFYSARLHRYVVFELKARKATPADIGQLAFYITAVERNLRTDRDDPTIGILLVADKDDVVIEYALAGTTVPMAVAAYAWEDLPADLRRGLPPAEDLDRAIHQVVRGLAAPETAASNSGDEPSAG